MAKNVKKKQPQDLFSALKTDITKEVSIQTETAKEPDNKTEENVHCKAEIRAYRNPAFSRNPGRNRKRNVPVRKACNTVVCCDAFDRPDGCSGDDHNA